MNTTTTTNATTTQTVHRHLLQILGENTVMLPAQFEIVSTMPHKKGVEIYTLIDPAAELEPTVLNVVKTGQIVPSAASQQWVATCAFPTMPARHVFRVIMANAAK